MSSDVDNEVMNQPPWMNDEGISSILVFCDSPPNFQNLPAEFRFFLKNLNYNMYIYMLQKFVKLLTQ
jgi:hypothetical protein